MTITDRLAEGQRETLAAGQLPEGAVFACVRHGHGAADGWVYNLTFPDVQATGLTLVILAGDMDTLLEVLSPAYQFVALVDVAADGYLDDLRTVEAQLGRLEDICERAEVMRGVPVAVMLDGAPVVSLDVLDLVERIAARREAGA